MTEKRSQIILEVAQAISIQLGMSDLLAFLHQVLKPVVHFDGIAVVVLDGETVRVHWAHREDPVNVPAKTLESILGHCVRGLKIDPLPISMPVCHHPISRILESGKEYVAFDLKAERGFDTDEPLLKAGFRSYIDLPLIKVGRPFGTIKFLSKDTALMPGLFSQPGAGQ